MFDAILGGFFIGISALMLMFCYGRIAGISDIFYSGINIVTEKQNAFNSIFFVFGLMLGSLAYYYLTHKSFPLPESSFPLAIIAGLFVGFGTGIGRGCTSGHGVCGISRFSPRSLVATIIFILVGMLTVGLMKHVF